MSAVKKLETGVPRLDRLTLGPGGPTVQKLTPRESARIGAQHRRATGSDPGGSEYGV